MKTNRIYAYGYGTINCTTDFPTSVVHPECRDKYVQSFGPYRPSHVSTFHYDILGACPNFSHETKCAVCHKEFPRK